MRKNAFIHCHVCVIEIYFLDLCLEMNERKYKADKLLNNTNKFYYQFWLESTFIRTFTHHINRFYFMSK